MNIYAKKGDRVVFAYPKNGYDRHVATAAKYLKKDETYTIDHTEVGSWHTDVYLQEIPGVSFNSVQFVDAEEIDIGY